MSHDSANHSASMFATPDEAIKAPQEQYLYVACLHEGTGVDKPDYLAVVDADPDSPEYAQVVPGCRCPKSATSCTTSAGTLSSACHGSRPTPVPDPARPRLGRIHIVDSPTTRAGPKMHKVIEPEEVIAKTKLTAPAHGPLPGRRQIMISHARRRERRATPGGFLLLDDGSST